MSPCTILIPTSPIPSMPFTDVITTTVERIRAYPELADVPIIVTMDGMGDHLRIESETTQNAGDRGSDSVFEQRRLRYADYKQRLRDFVGNGYWKNVRLVEFEKHTHQAGMARTVIRDGTLATPLMLTFDHGTFPVGDIPWTRLFAAAQNPAVNSIRLYNFEEIHPEHRHLFDETRQTVDGVPLMRTIQFSGRPNLCRTAWYLQMLDENLGEGSRCFLEDIMWPVCSNVGWPGWDEFKLWIYAPDTLNWYQNVNERGTFPIAEMVIRPGTRPR